MLRQKLNDCRRILCIGAHADDIEIGCGATLLKLLAQTDKAVVHWVVLSASEERELEAKQSANTFLVNCEQKKIIVKHFRDAYFPYEAIKIKEYFQELRAEFSPDLIFTHRLEDRHQDHRLVAELTWNTFRNHLIFEYDVPKYEGDLGQPNVFVEVSEEDGRKKITNLLRHFPSQKSKSWFSPETFQALLHLRGIECNATSRSAEGFYCRKMVF